MNQHQLDNKINEIYNFGDDTNPILDGIVDEAEYYSGIPKILWILKEPYDLGDGHGGWNSRDKIREKAYEYFKIPTWRRIAYSSYGIIKNLNYEQVKTQERVFDILKSISFINVSKYPGNTTSSNRWKYFEDIYLKCKTVLLEQIKCYNPDIIIIGNLTYLFLPDFNLTWDDKISLPLMKKFFFNYSDKLLIDAYHPGVREKDISESDYCNAIINTATDF